MRNEFNPFDDKEESSEKKDKDSKREEKRLVPPPSLFPVERIPGLRPPMVETQAEESKDDDDDDLDEGDGKEKKQSEPAAEKASEEHQGPESTPAENQVAAEGAETEPPAEVGDSVEEPAAEQPWESEFAEPTTAGQFDDAGTLHIRRAPNEYTPGFATPELAAPDEDDDNATAASSQQPASGFFPPRPPIVPPSAEAGPAGEPEEPQPAQNQYMGRRSWNTTNSQFVTAEQHRSEVKDAREESEKRGLRRGLVAGFITGYVLKAYLSNRKHERYEKAVSKQLNERSEQINYLQQEQQKLGEQLKVRTAEFKSSQEQLLKNQSARFEKPAGKPSPEALPPVKTAETAQIFDQEGNEIILQPGWKVERSAGGYSVVLDEHNRVVHDAIHYGEAFKRDQKREQLSEDLFAAVGGGSPVGGPQDSGLGPVPAAPGQLPGVQYTPPSTQQPTVDLNHRLPKPRNQVVATVASPWLWTAVAILIIVYFIAALA